MLPCSAPLGPPGFGLDGEMESHLLNDPPSGQIRLKLNRETSVSGESLECLGLASRRLCSEMNV